MCANALASFAGENPSWELGRGKSGDNYVVPTVANIIHSALTVNGPGHLYK